MIVEHWDGKLVLAKMIDAYKILYDTTGRVGPSRGGSSWPEMQLDAIDKAIQQRSEEAVTGLLRARVQRTSKEVKLCDHVFTGFKIRGVEYHPWLWQFLEHKRGMKTCVAMHVKGQAQADLRNVSFNAKKMCRRRDLAYSTFRSRRNDGARLIAQGLNELGVIL